MQTTPWAGTPQADIPLANTPGQTPPWADTPQGRHPQADTPSPADDHCIRWYASYWNHFLRENLVGKSCATGNSCGKILWENRMANSCGKILWEIVAGNCCGKFLWENLAGNSCGKILWEMEEGKKPI